MTEEKLRKIVIGSMLIMCVALVFGIVKLNLKYAKERQEAHLPEPEMIEEPIEKIEDKDIEKEKKELNIPPIEKPKEVEKDDNIDSKEEVVEKEVYEEIEGEKVPVRSIPTPQTKNLPEGMENPNSKKEPTTPSKPSNTEVVNNKDDSLDQDNKNDKPKKEEQEVVKGGTGSDGVLRDTKGNPITSLKPATKVEEVTAEELNKEFNTNYTPGQGDKF